MLFQEFDDIPFCFKLRGIERSKVLPFISRFCQVYELKKCFVEYKVCVILGEIVDVCWEENKLLQDATFCYFVKN